MVKIVMQIKVTEVLEIVSSPLEKDVYLVRSVYTRTFLFFARTCMDLSQQDHRNFSFLPQGIHLGVWGFCHGWPIPKRKHPGVGEGSSKNPQQTFEILNNLSYTPDFYQREKSLWISVSFYGKPVSSRHFCPVISTLLITWSTENTLLSKGGMTLVFSCRLKKRKKTPQ